MSTVTKPMALDETFKTSESTPRNQADVLAGIQQAIREGFGQVASAVEYDNTDSGLTATNVQDAVDEVDAALDVVEDDIESIEDDIESIKEVTGNPITITDAAGINAESLKVEFSPKQDLHGYDFPWVGGAGKNKLELNKADYSDSGVAVTFDRDNGTVKLNGTSLNGAYLRLIDTFTTYLSGAAIISMFIPSAVSGAYLGYDVVSGSGSSVELTPNSDGYVEISVNEISNILRIWIYLNSGGITFNNYIMRPMIRLSTETDPTFAPYSNICPISGYEGVEVEDVGFNQWDEEWESGGIDYNTGNETQDADRIRSKNFIFVFPNTEYFIKSGGHTTALRFYDANKNYISYGAAYNTDRTFTPPSNCKYLKFIILETTYNHDICINISKPTGTPKNGDYVPYHSSNATIQFGQTVYGGSVDVTNGGTDDERNKVTIGDLNWYYDSNTQLFYCDISVMLLGADGGEIVCSGYKYNNSANNLDDIANGEIWNKYLGESSKNVCIKNTNYSNVTDFVNANSSVEICYVKETATTIATPKTDLKLLQDTNNLSTNGTTITLDYIPNNSIGDAVKASEEYTDRAVERVIPKAKLACFYEIFDESGTLYDANIPEDCNFFLVEYRIQNRIGSTLIKAKSIDFYIPVVVNVGGEQHWVEFLYNSIYHTIDYTSNVTTGFGVLSIYTI